MLHVIKTLKIMIAISMPLQHFLFHLMHTTHSDMVNSKSFIDRLSAFMTFSCKMCDHCEIPACHEGAFRNLKSKKRLI